MAGSLVLVVGPSGAGKDALLGRARLALAGDPRFVFVRRVVTRRSDTALEDHETTTQAEFEALESAGGFALSWRAHGLCYGLPAAILGDLGAGRTVIANASRAALATAARRFAALHVLVVDAPRALRAERLAARGREGADEIEARLAREVTTLPTGLRTVVIDNSGTLQNAVAGMLRALADMAG